MTVTADDAAREAERARIKEREADYAHFHYEGNPMTKPTPAPEAAPDVMTHRTGGNPSPELPDPLAGLIRGRVVWYTPTQAEARHADPGPWAAMVVHVGPESLPGQVTLVVFVPVPTLIGNDPCARRTEVPYSASGEAGSWNWPERA